MTAHPPLPLPRLPPRHRAVLALVVLVALAHAWLLGAWPMAPGPGARAQPAPPLQVRQIARTAAPAAATVAAERIAKALPAAGTVRMSQGAPPAPPAAPPAMQAAATVPASPAPRADGAAAALATPSPGALEVPVYATRLPPAMVAVYAQRRGGAVGEAELRWLPEADGYRLRLRSGIGGALAWASEGALDRHGLAPERHGEYRRGRELRAVNFQREGARITFSGPAQAYALVDGAQDRLSWWIQLAAVMAADPQRAAPGAQVAMFVAGTRGDAEVWTFEVLGTEDLDGPAGRVTGALHLRREPTRPYDTRVDVWLDPARHHLPVRAWLRVRATGEGSDFELIAMRPPDDGGARP